MNYRRIQDEWDKMTSAMKLELTVILCLSVACVGLIVALVDHLVHHA